MSDDKRVNVDVSGGGGWIAITIFYIWLNIFYIWSNWEGPLKVELVATECAQQAEATGEFKPVERGEFDV